ncbi:MAG: flagellar export protein FliJ [Phycisphaerales bacterium]|nr:flagellar export protein FliJ [Phycisphaerales bacterium]
MARFRFTLEPVLEMRRREEREHQRRVAELERQRLDIEAQVERHESMLSAERGDLRDRLAPGAGSSGTAFAAVRAQAAASVDAVRRLRRLALDLSGVMERLARARSELAHAAARRKAVELLRERRFAEWLADGARREQAGQDDLSTMRAGRPELNELKP